MGKIDGIVVATIVGGGACSALLGGLLLECLPLGLQIFAQCRNGWNNLVVVVVVAVACGYYNLAP